MVRYVYARSEFWRQKLRQAGIDEETFLGLHSLSDLPFSEKSELQSNQLEAGPFGSYACTPPEEWTRFFATSGTTGRPLFRVFSDRDWRLHPRPVRPQLRMAPDHDIVLMTAPTDGLIGPTAFLEIGPGGRRTRHPSWHVAHLAQAHQSANPAERHQWNNQLLGAPSRGGQGRRSRSEPVRCATAELCG